MTNCMKIELQNVLKRELKARHKTINALARECGIPTSVLHSWVQGVLPSAKNLHHVLALAKCLGLPVSTLLFNEAEVETGSSLISTTEFSDGESKFRLLVMKVAKGASQ